MVTNFPSRHICLILFARTVAPQLVGIAPRAKRSTVAPWRTPWLLDHLTRLQHHRLRHRQAERFGRPGVDHEIELRRLLDRQLAGLRALEDLVHVAGGPPYDRVEVWPVRQERALLGPR